MDDTLERAWDMAHDIIRMFAKFEGNFNWKTPDERAMSVIVAAITNKYGEDVARKTIIKMSAEQDNFERLHRQEVE